MLLSKIKTHYEKSEGRRICQGDILRDIQFSSIYKTELEVPVLINYGIVMSQDCDLQHDFENREEVIKKTGENKDNTSHDKFLPTILICPAYASGSFFLGEHVGGWKMQNFGIKEQEKLRKNNQFQRFHVLNANTELTIPELVIDFKHFYTVPNEILHSQFKSAYVATVNELFRERLSQRFSDYLSRFALPEI